MINYFWIEIKGKNPKKFLTKVLKLKINIESIKYERDRVLLKVSYDDYKKIKQINTIYEINIIRTCGKRRVIEILDKYKVLILTFIISIFFLVVISNRILFIDIDTDNKSMKALIKESLRDNNIMLYSRKRSYDVLNKVTKSIKNNNLDKIEWIELEQKGVYLNVRVIERVSSSTKEDTSFKDIVASKNGYIRKVYSRKGQLLKNIDDYVKKGDVIISGNIYRNDKVIDKVRAEGKVYAEVWYIVKVNDALRHSTLVEKDKGVKRLVLRVNNKEISLLSIPKEVVSNSKRTLYKNNSFSLYIKNEINYIKKDEKRSEFVLKKILEERAKSAINNTLDKDEYIIKQKTLKKYVKDGKMYIEVFFKTYEDISLIKDIKEEIDKEEEE